MKRIRKGDMVVVTTGKEKGKRGKILRFTGNDRVVVERIMMVKRHTKPTQKSPQGGIIEKEGSIHISNVMPLDPGSDKATRVTIKMDGDKRRRIGKSGTVIEASK